MLSKVGKWYSEIFLYKGSRWMTILCQVALLVAMMSNVIMVVVRKPFVAFGWHLGPVVYAYEITQITMIFFSSAAVGYTWYTAGHIRIGLFRDNMKEKTRNILDAVVAFLAVIYVPLVVWGMLLLAQGSKGGYLHLSRIPIVPLMITYCVIMTHVFLVFLRSFIGLASKAMGKQFAVEPYLERQ
ncbi:TRAP transporter small permease subunit [Chloroflexota bacterium]